MRAAVAKTAAPKKAGAKKGGKRLAKRTWSGYVKKALKNVKNAKKARMSSKAVKVVNSFVSDIFDRIAVQAAALVRANKKRTLGSAEIQTAVRLVLPAELAKHAIQEGTKAVKALSA